CARDVGSAWSFYNSLDVW
nr:immunoglobulin heavy chain junction region [Macaca mulatta]MOX92192.1 immunoglobulin heavy chain junction region [Macaca mulatta]MOX92599.1 immunoglobulin heavy chain junction region [Macaca mulatta]MOX92644.1 immunoglobulin heavy chain junction region [Macaca mulatta]MOX92993.1 immunoglobulin heavy chain junction region [Macaca mulatta]